jgi:hypothetical protein
MPPARWALKIAATGRNEDVAAVAAAVRRLLDHATECRTAQRPNEVTLDGLVHRPGAESQHGRRQGVSLLAFAFECWHARSKISVPANRVEGHERRSVIPGRV